MQLPTEFEGRMQKMLGADYGAFLASYEKPYRNALRINPLKHVAPDSLPFALSPVAWTDGGYYYEANDHPGRHPFHDMGLYYIQEASAMLPAFLAHPEQSDKVLDLCASPGGKTTQLAGFLGEEGLLVSNEIDPTRCEVLSRNVERMGIRNCIVTNEAPKNLAQTFPAFFDKIVVDAPCSGEGMFRKEPQAVTMWSEENVRMCAERQDSILQEADKMLKNGGTLTYSTCTFAPLEDEGTIARFLSAHPNYEVLPPTDAIIRQCLADGVLDVGHGEWVTEEESVREQLKNALRIFPHHADGEGHFAVVLYKNGTDSGSDSPKKEKAKAREEKKHNPPSKEKPTVSDAVLKQIILEWELDSFQFLYKIFADKIYALPKKCDFSIDVSGLKILRYGIFLGTVSKGRFTPDHAFALALSKDTFGNTYECSEKELASYLHGDTLSVSVPNGWVLLTAFGQPVGWGKSVDGVIKNHYPKGLRR